MNIYAITNLKNNKQYIGREKHYKPEYYGSGKLIKEAIKKYGKKNFKKEILIDDRNIDNWEECSELEVVCKLSFSSIIPEGYNIHCWEYPIPLELLQRSGKIVGEQNKRLKRGICNPEIRRKAREKAKELGVGFYDSKVQSMNGKIGGKIVGEQNKKLKRGWLAPGIAAKGGRISGKIVGKRMKELGKGIFAPGMQRKGGKKARELKVGCHAPENFGKGGKQSAHTLFEIDGLIQQMTLGKLLKL